MATPRPDLHTLHNAAGATGNGEALDTLGYTHATVQLSGTFVATVTWEISADGGTTWAGVMATPAATGTKAATATAAGVYIIPCAGCDKARARISAFTSGTVTAKGRPSLSAGVTP